jgi:hypothetical protein
MNKQLVISVFLGHLSLS